MHWIQEADVVVTEVSTPSLGVGYEIGKAENLDKQMLCLYRPQENKQLSAMISGNPNQTIAEYHNLEDAISRIDKFFGAMK